MIRAVLLAVDDSRGSMAAARAAVDLAAVPGGRLRVVNVLIDGALTEALGRAAGRPGVPGRRGLAATTLLRHVEELARVAGVAAETAQLSGEPASEILRDAATWRPDVIVVGVSSRDGVGTPYIGAQTRHLLEFSEWPVLVVPARS